MDKIYTAEEVRDLLKCSLTFVYKHKWELGAVRVGTLIRFPESGLRGFLDVDMEKREEVVVQIPMAGRVDLERKGIQQPARRKIGTGAETRGAFKDEEDQFGLRQALRESLAGATVKKGSLLLVG